jgi:hypothetical protein
MIPAKGDRINRLGRLAERFSELVPQESASPRYPQKRHRVEPEPGKEYSSDDSLLNGTSRARQAVHTAAMYPDLLTQMVRERLDAEEDRAIRERLNGSPGRSPKRTPKFKKNRGPRLTYGRQSPAAEADVSGFRYKVRQLAETLEAPKKRSKTEECRCCQRLSQPRPPKSPPERAFEPKRDKEEQMRRAEELAVPRRRLEPPEPHSPPTRTTEEQEREAVRMSAPAKRVGGTDRIKERVLRLGTPTPRRFLRSRIRGPDGFRIAQDDLMCYEPEGLSGD